MHVVNFEPKTAPNPRCCSEPGVLCQRCATSALTMNIPPESNRSANEDPPLLIPTINWARERQSEIHENRRTATTNSVDDDILPLPRMEW